MVVTIYTPLSNQANNVMPLISDTMFPPIDSASCYTFEDFISDIKGITPSEEGMDAVNRLAQVGGFESPDIQSAIAQAWDMRDWCYAS
jgi:hypothetical protein